MGKTKDLFKKIRDTKETFQAVFLRHFIYYPWTKGALGEKITLGMCLSHFHLQFGVRIWSLSLFDASEKPGTYIVN